MNRSERKWGLNALSLKLLAMGLMLCDHLWATVIPDSGWLTDLGRMAFPIFAFQVVEGYFETSSFRGYLKRMFLFALISEIPYNLMTGGSIYNPFGQNVLFTFCIGLLLIRLLEKAKAKNPVVNLLTAVGAAGLGYVLGTISFCDYYGGGVLTVLLFYVCRGKKWGPLALIPGLLYLNTDVMGSLMYEAHLFGYSFFIYQQAYAVLALIPIYLYNGRQGPHSPWIRLGCYLFYPVHMLILSLIWLYGLGA